MRKLKEHEKIGTFTSVWDDGAISIDSPCIVNTKTKQIVKIYKKGRELWTEEEGITKSNVDDFVEILNDESVTIDDVKYPVKPEAEKNLDETGYWYY